jgi:hypothetical protein
MNCPSASIAVNCCQFSYCIPTIPAIDFPISLHPDWMSNLIQSCPDIKIGEIVIPGTHDSGSYSIDAFKLYSAVGRTQNVTILEQLHRGARFLDLRVAESGKDVHIFHGCLKGCKLERVLDDIHLFCQDFPGEFLIVQIVAEYGRSFGAKQKKNALDIVQSSLGDKMYMESSVETLLDSSLKDLTMKGKQVCVVLHPRIYENFSVDGVDYTDSYISKEYSCYNADGWLCNKW